MLVFISIFLLWCRAVVDDMSCPAVRRITPDSRAGCLVWPMISVIAIEAIKAIEAIMPAT